MAGLPLLFTAGPAAIAGPVVWSPHAPRCTLSSARGAGMAPLAQSVERFHGKEKVNGSIPLGGSANAFRDSDWRSYRGGVAQLVRAHDS